MHFGSNIYWETGCVLGFLVLLLTHGCMCKAISINTNPSVIQFLKINLVSENVNILWVLKLDFCNVNKEEKKSIMKLYVEERQ